MSPDDPRHGTVAGYNRIPCREMCCRRAYARYRKGLEWDNMRGLPRIVSAVGVRRRFDGLQLRGWSGAALMAEAGLTDANLTRIIGSETMTRSQRDRLVAACERLAEREPTGPLQPIASSISRAKRRGAVPLEQWLDIDDPAETPDPGYRDSFRFGHEFDEVMVERMLAGDWSLAPSSTKSEKVAVCAAWVARGQTANELERLTGWATRRYLSTARSEVA